MQNIRKNQTDKVLAYMRKHGGINTYQAFRDLGITRLSARIWELIHVRGLNITKSIVVKKSEDGTPRSYVRYKEVKD